MGEVIHKNVTAFGTRGYMPCLCGLDETLDKKITLDQKKVTCKKCIQKMKEMEVKAMNFRTIDGKWWLFKDSSPVRQLTDKESADVIWGIGDCIVPEL